jgi:integrase
VKSAGDGGDQLTWSNEMSEVFESAGGRSVAGSAEQTGAERRPSAPALELAVHEREARSTAMLCNVAPPALPLRAGTLPLSELIDLYMAYYAGRDSTRVQRLGWWRGQVGEIRLQDLTDDHVHAATEALALQHSRFFAGKDADGRAIYRAKRRPLAPATINRYVASLAAVMTWSIKRRIAPKGYAHPCRSIERRPEHNEKTRFLSDDECKRLLDACRASTWPRLYLLVLMALTTGARKGELAGLTWADVDIERAEAFVGRTKNGDPRVLPLVPAVVEQLQRFSAGPPTLVFRSPRDAQRFHTLRHSAASMLARSGATLLEIGDLLGHRQLQMTKRYSHLATSHKAALVNRVLGNVR